MFLSLFRGLFSQALFPWISGNLVALALGIIMAMAAYIGYLHYTYPNVDSYKQEISDCRESIENLVSAIGNSDEQRRITNEYIEKLQNRSLKNLNNDFSSNSLDELRKLLNPEKPGEK